MARAAIHVLDGTDRDHTIPSSRRRYPKIFR